MPSSVLIAIDIQNMSNKILILTNNLSGFVNFRIEVVHALIGAGYEVHVSAPADETAVALAKAGVTLHPTEINRHGTNPLQELALKRHYRSLITNIKPDVILTYTIKPNIYGGFEAKWAGIPYIPNVTGLGVALNSRSPLQSLLVSLYKKSLVGAAHVFFQNNENARFFYERGLSAERTEILPGSGVNLEKHTFEPYPAEGGPVILSVIGRLMKDKGTDEVLEAARVLHPKHPDLIIRFIGPFDGEYEEKVKAAVSEGLVEYVPNQADIHPWMKESSAILHASYHEGMSNVLLEAAATGRPVLATDVPGCRETFIDGESGIAFPPRNAGAIASAVERFLGLSRAARAEMGRKGRQYVEEHFDRKIVVERYLKAVSAAISD